MKMDRILWTSSEAAAVMGGAAEGVWHATGVSISMEHLRPGDLYFATREDDLRQVFSKGAAAAVIAGGTGSGHPWPVVKVRDVYTALQNLAAASRYRTHGAIVSIQGRKAREAVAALLGKTGCVHEGGRHVSLGLAALPEDIDFGLFALSPAVRPDIAVIGGSAGQSHDALFAAMPRAGSVIINADDEGHAMALACARAGGMRNIFTYGTAGGADARLCGRIDAGNGSRITARIMGEDVSLLAPRGFDCGGLLAGLLILKLTGRPLAQAVRAFEASHALISSFESVTLIEPVRQEKSAERAQAIFKIRSMIDWGFGRRTAVLENFAGTGRPGLSFSARNFSMPARKEKIDFVYTGCAPGAVPDARAALAQTYSAAPPQSIVPDVIAPGDFLVFREIWHSPKAIFSEALRLTPDRKMKKPNAL